MTPIDPVKPASEDPASPMAPPYVDEDINLESVRKGMRVAEDEKRDLVAENYEAEARMAEDSEDQLDDIDRTLEDGGDESPELAAIHKTSPPREP